MSVTEHELEERAVAPRVTLGDVERTVMFEHYFTAAQGIRANGERYPITGKFEGKMESLERLTFCVLTLRNGFTVVGQSACASAANYQQDIGERIAKSDALNKIWALKGYELCTKIAAGLL